MAERRFRGRAALSLLLIVPLGFLTKLYSGPGAYWFNDSAGGILYEIFWCLVFAFLRPRWRPAWICSGVFFVTSVLEFLQLWHPPLLDGIRATFIGRTLIGTHFVWMDLPYYALGCVLGYAWIRLLCGGTSRETSKES